MNPGEIARTAREKGGITLRLRDDVQPVAGFAVSIPGHEVKHPTANTYDVAHYVLAKLPAIMEHGDHACLGMWLNEGTWYYDISEVHHTLDAALAAARKAGQLAVYDLAERREIQVGWDHG